jgi:hypothetical protein
MSSRGRAFHVRVRLYRTWGPSVPYTGARAGLIVRGGFASRDKIAYRASVASGARIADGGAPSPHTGDGGAACVR